MAVQALPSIPGRALMFQNTPSIPLTVRKYRMPPPFILNPLGWLCRRYLASQAVVQPLMVVTLLATLLTPFFLYLFVLKWVVWAGWCAFAGLPVISGSFA